MTPSEIILGYSIDTRDAAECIADVLRSIDTGGQARWLACMNPHSYVLAIDDHRFANALRAANWLIPDGIGVVLASRFMRGKVRKRVTGSDMFWGLQQELNSRGNCSVFFLGSTEETLAIVRDRVVRDFPRIRLAGIYSPPFKDSFTTAENDLILAAINSSAPDVLWVGMTAPRQEKWIFENQSRLNVKFIGAVGAVFDFYSGRVRRSHPTFQKLGLEWLPRLIQQPRRLWRRMFVSAPVFAWHVLRQRFRT